jgi:aryl-alcohol dehydrogenase-like predicted oxidoreductase
MSANRRLLGRTGVSVSPLCLGSGAFGAGNKDHSDCARIVHRALAWVIRHPVVTSAIIGPRTMEHLESQLGADEVVLADEVLDRIDEIMPPGHNANEIDTAYVNSGLRRSARRRPAGIPVMAR